MSRILDLSGKWTLACALALTIVIPLGGAQATSFTILYRFAGAKTGDGAHPDSGVIADSAGNLYGTTFQGGDAGYQDCRRVGCGTVFKLAPDGTESPLYDFTGSHGDAWPLGGLIADKAGNLYGEALQNVFKIAPNGTETVLHAFQGGNDGANPDSSLVRDNAGNLYGTTSYGGNAGCNESYGCGTVFKLARNGTESILYVFCSQSNCTDGEYPAGGLAADSVGNLYGTTRQGGNTGCVNGLGKGCGTVFKLAPDGTETVLYTFLDGSDGASPWSGVIADAAGNLYGTTQEGAQGGTVFKIAPDGSETVLHTFTGGSDGSAPTAGVIVDSAGNLYGTTPTGGGTGCQGGGGSGCGTVFKIAPDGTETILHSFAGNGNGYFPDGRLLLRNGSLYGTAYYSRDSGHGGFGFVFKVQK